MTEQADLDALAKTAAGSGGGGAETAAGGGGDGSRQPTDRAELVKWLQSDKGPGVQAFALAADAMLRSQGIMKGAAPVQAEWQAHHTGAVWGELDFCTGGLDMTGLLIGNEVFLGDGSTTQDAAKLAWWAGQGQKVPRAYGSALKGQMSSRLLHKDELSGKVISQPEATMIYNSALFPKVLKAVQEDDLATVQMHLDGSSDAAIKLRRGLMYFQLIAGMKIQEGEPQRKAVFNLMIEINRMIAEKLQGKIQNLFVNRRSTSLAFAEKVRDSLVTIVATKEAVRDTMAVLLECRVSDLGGMQYAELHPAVRAVGEFWQIALGSRIGEDAGRNLVAVLDTWAQVDTTFGSWKQFAPKDEATPMALVNRIIIPRVKEWMEGFWEFLRTGKKEPDTKLQEWVEARTMKLEDDDYADMVKATKRLRRGTNVGGDDMLTLSTRS
jgi:hypothetical protein